MAAKDLKVFISYARRDGGSFAEELHTGLELAGFSPYLDQEDIAPGEDWEHRLERLIETADAIVFVVSPMSVASERCAWEIDHATALGKRLIPVVAIDVPNEAAPPQLTRRNYIFFNRGASFTKALKELSTALSTNLEWVREHTRLMELANRWTRRNREQALLLRGAELRSAEAWLASPNVDPEPTATHREFIEASQALEAREAAEEQRRAGELNVERSLTDEFRQRSNRRTILAGGAGLLAVGAAGWGIWASGESGREKQRAIERESRRKLTGQTAVYATGVGAAADVQVFPGEVSVFSKSLFEALADKDAPFLSAVTEAYSAIRRWSSGTQTPSLSSTMNADYYLHHPSPTRRTAALIAAVSEVGSAKFETVERDGEAWQRLLAGAGFETELHKNPSFEEFSKAHYAFLHRRPKPEEPAPSVTPVAKGPLDDTLYLVIYIGEGAYIGEQRLLCFKDTNFDSVETLRQSSIDTAQLGADLEGRASASIMLVNCGFIYTAKTA